MADEPGEELGEHGQTVMRSAVRVRTDDARSLVGGYGQAWVNRIRGMDSVGAWTLPVACDGRLGDEVVRAWNAASSTMESAAFPAKLAAAVESALFQVV